MTNHLISIWILGLALAVASAAEGPAVTGKPTGAFVPTGDRNTKQQIILPEACFMTNGGRVIDITKPPYEAKGDGKTDDTAAFVKVMNFLSEELIKGRTGKNERTWKLHVYLPIGTYLVSDSLVHEGPRTPKEGFAGLNIIGQERSRTIIKLKDNAPGFGPGTRKPVLNWFEDWGGSGVGVAGSGQAWGNGLNNITVDTGRGNPGAVGVAFIASNAGVVSNLTVTSGDGQGYCGLLFPTWSVQGYMHDITVQGFDYGIRSEPPAEPCPTLEHITLSGQKIAGVWLTRSCASIRNLVSDNAVPALVLEDKSVQAVLIDSLLRGTNTGTAAAIEMRKSDAQHLLLRGVTTSGYVHALKAGEFTLPKGPVVEYNSGKTVSLFPSPACTLDLPIEDAPVPTWPSKADDWAVIPAGADLATMQAAFNSGKSAVVFVGVHDRGSPGNIRVPPTVRQIELMGAEIYRDLEVEAADTPLIFNGPGGHSRVSLKGPRTLVCEGGVMSFGCATDQPVKAFFNALVLSTGEKDFCTKNMRVWARSINDENRGRPQYTVDGGSLWVLGYKSEAGQASFTVRSGFLEVLGGYRNRAGGGDLGRPQLMVEGGHVSFTGFSSMARDYKEAIWEQRGDELRKVALSDLPRRGVYNLDFFIPLYTSFDPAALPRKPRGLAGAQTKWE